MWAWSICRGKPSTKKRPFPSPHPCSTLSLCFSSSLEIALWRSLTVTSLGTILPSLILVRMSSPYSDPSLCCSARRRSPAVILNQMAILLDGCLSAPPERCEKPNSVTNFSHWVPFPMDTMAQSVPVGSSAPLWTTNLHPDHLEQRWQEPCCDQRLHGLDGICFWFYQWFLEGLALTLMYAGGFKLLADVRLGSLGPFSRCLSTNTKAPNAITCTKRAH